MKKVFLTITMFSTICATAQSDTFLRENYRKIDTMIPMRDGIKLYTIVYIPKDASEKYPFLIQRTPYSVAPYDTGYTRRLGPNPNLLREKYIFVNQDVRGRYMSEGNNLEVTPHQPDKKNKTEVDESSDTFDTIEWLLKNIPNNNGRAGIYGISYPGFYATAALADAHPALKAASPQAPITDEFMGDDVNHNGAFFLMDNFNFMNYYAKERSGLVKDYGDEVFPVKILDAYDYFLKMGPISTTQTEKYFNGKSRYWNEYLEHDTYDDYWKSRNIRNHLHQIHVPTLVVGGWFDAEDLYGALKTYETLEKNNPENKNYLVMGPWTHGAWAAQKWEQYATHDFGSNTSAYFQDSIETVFFNYYLKDKGSLKIPKASIFETGSNQWRPYSSWPPVQVNTTYYLQPDQLLTTQKSLSENSYDEYLSDPNKPVPYTSGIYGWRNNDYMAEDQRFAAMRPDVLVYQTVPLTTDLTIAGSITADLQVSISGSDADFVVKVIDVLPDNEPNFKNAPKGFQMPGYQRLVRAEVIRGKFRQDLSKPIPFIPNKPEQVSIALNDIHHTFKKGHRIMVQIQSSWFPLVDRNPQKFMPIAKAKASDFEKAMIRIYHNSKRSSKLVFPVLKK
jgi:putative CocE/NonD family hydrolase